MQSTLHDSFLLVIAMFIFSVVNETLIQGWLIIRGENIRALKQKVKDIKK
jgi:hypothetical protein